ncbi:helix-turn-helix domain-containing protein [Dehalococcoides mccartyi]|nr:helix-turn-helix transcriptional regulator [Dehalococcoides mccartyi]
MCYSHISNSERRSNMEEANLGQFLKSLRDRQRMSLRDAEKESGVSNAYIAQLEKGDRPAPSPDILKKLAKAYNVTVRELLMRAGYLDEPEVTATEEQRIEAAFQYVLADPDYKLGTRLRGEDFDTKGKRGVVITYETLTGKKILSI